MRITVAAVSLVTVVLLVVFGYLVLGNRFARVAGIGDDSNTADISHAGASANQVPMPTEEEIRLQEATDAGADPNDPNVYYLPTPLIATYNDINIHSPVSANNITEIEFHQASYDIALQVTPLVTIVDAEAVIEQHGTNHIAFDEQPTGGEPLVAEAVSTWRHNANGAERTAMDVGAVFGTYVYAPVSGTVVKAKSYLLYGRVDDCEIHIQNPEHPELDIVMLHVDELEIAVGDEVKGGCTRMAKIRDISASVGNNLANFTAPDDPGNHCHVQVNDATREDYKGLEGALDIFNGHGYARPEPTEAEA
jgi:hypothetical protein